ncbi:MAG: helix-turn-helix transcriptional regulator, partial [Alphaproteobacteria bacterium]|nr:helix-turn-helix transcriptional regulator [Alphaproteobacteria bacterium]
RSAPGAKPAPATLTGEVAAPARPQADPDGAREAFRAFMTGNRLRATEWAREAGVPAAQIYAFLTGKSRSLHPDTAKKLARAAQVSAADLFRTRK